MDPLQPHKPTPTRPATSSDTTSAPDDPPGIVWRPLDGSNAALSLRSPRGAESPSPAQRIIAYIRAEGTPPPEISGPAKRSYTSRLLLECPICSTPFASPRADVRKAAVRDGLMYCSTTCASEGVSRQFQERFCHCGKPVPRSRRSTCSDECLREKYRQESRHADCPECGREFKATSSRTVFCSRACADRAHSKRMTGEGNSHHRPASSPTYHFRQIRPSIIERDGYRCAICATSTDLIVHHCDEDPANNRAENLITLCDSCHKTHHKSAETPFPWLPTLARLRSTTSK